MHEYTETAYVIDLVPGQFSFYVRSGPGGVMNTLEPPLLVKAHLFHSEEAANEVIEELRSVYPYARVIRMDAKYTMTPDPSSS